MCLQIRPDTVAFNAYMSAADKAGTLEDVQEIFHAMQVQPTSARGSVFECFVLCCVVCCFAYVAVASSVCLRLRSIPHPCSLKFGLRGQHP
eukprot:1572729-Rhodomonas_salina.1